MSKTLIILLIAMAFLLWKFVLFPEKLDFTDKMKVLQGLTLAKSHKQAVIKYWQANKTFPSEEQWQADGPEMNVNLGNSIVSKITVGEKTPGSITLYYSNSRDPGLAPQISGKSLNLSPYEYNGKIEWSCKGDIPEEFLPKACR